MNSEMEFFAATEATKNNEYSNNFCEEEQSKAQTVQESVAESPTLIKVKSIPHKPKERKYKLPQLKLKKRLSSSSVYKKN